MTQTLDSIHTTGGVLAGRREAIIAEGPDAFDFLQGQLSQDLAAISVGASAWSLLLQPQGKISAWLRITRMSDDRFVLDVDSGWSNEVLTRLNRFKLRTACEIELAPWSSVTVFGPAQPATTGAVELELSDNWAGLAVRDLFGPGLSAEGSIDAADYTSLRIAAGVPAMGAELDESTIPAAAGIVEQSVSFTKGCYTGQELVARIDSRGNNVPKRLVGLVFPDDSGLTAGSALRSGENDDAVGVLTSVGRFDDGRSIALGYVSRKVDVGAAVRTVESDVSAEVRLLPLTSS